MKATPMTVVELAKLREDVKGFMDCNHTGQDRVEMK
jgi:hypothetical protein